jgi:glycosyltransferase involved in cell wall biosynthesis
MKAVIVYDRVNKWGGAERVLLALHEIFPKAPLYTSVYDKKNASWARVFPKVKTSFLQKIPFARSNHEFLAPLMPFAFESFDFSDLDLVISVTSEFAKNIKTHGKTIHICYCLTPTRYLWSGYNEYFKGSTFKGITKPVVSFLRHVDQNAAKRPDVMLSISSEVKKRIKKYYHRDSKIVYPPVEINNLKVINNLKLKTKKYYLIVSRLVGYKKIDLAIEVFNKLGYPLVIVGIGREEKKLKSVANKNIKFIGRISDKELAIYYRNAKALIMPQEEDFGIVAVEAQSYSVPVIAFKKGGASDTVVDAKTGILFDKQNEKSLSEAILRFEKIKYKADNLITNAKKFSKEKFKQNFDRIVKDATRKQ